MSRVLFFEDLELGVPVEGAARYLLERDDVVSFAKRWDPQPFHVDEEAALRSPAGGLTASGVHLFAIRSWLLHHSGVSFALLAALGTEESRIHAPARPGDRLALVLEWQRNASRGAAPTREWPGSGARCATRTTRRC